MDTALVVPAYNRPAYFLAAITALAAADRRGIDDTYVFFDGPQTDRDAEAQKLMQAHLRQLLPHAHVHRWGDHLGPDRALPRMHRELFGAGYGAIIQVEDDYVVAPYALKALRALFEGAAKTAGSDLILPTLHAWCTMTETQKRGCLAQVDRTPANVPSYLCTLITRRVFEATRGPVDDYCAMIAASETIPTGPVRGLIAETLGQPLPPDTMWATSYDGVLGAAAYAAGVRAIQPQVNHGVYIGRHGAHDNTRIFEQYGAGRMRLDCLPEVVDVLRHRPELPDFELEVW